MDTQLAIARAASDLRHVGRRIATLPVDHPDRLTLLLEAARLRAASASMRWQLVRDIPRRA
jgi:hypothetical protein